MNTGIRNGASTVMKYRDSTFFSKIFNVSVPYPEIRGVLRSVPYTVRRRSFFPVA